MKKLTTVNGCINALLKLLPEPILLPLCILSKPPVAPRLLADNPEPEPEPMGVLPCKSGKLNVDEPSPVPYVVDTAENNDEYVLLLTA